MTYSSISTCDERFSLDCVSESEIDHISLSKMGNLQKEPGKVILILISSLMSQAGLRLGLTAPIRRHGTLLSATE